MCGIKLHHHTTWEPNQLIEEVRTRHGNQSMNACEVEFLKAFLQWRQSLLVFGFLALALICDDSSLIVGHSPLVIVVRGGGSSRWLQLRSLKAYGSISALYSTTQKSTTLVISACGSKVGHVVTTSLARHASIGAWMFVLCVQPHRNATQ